MALGSVSSLGFGSGVLTQDVIDQLKEAEESSRLTMYTTKIEENTTKQTDLTEIITKLSTFKSSVSSLADATAFAKRKVVSSVTENPPATLTADSGVALQSMKINVTQLAQKDVYQSKGLENDLGYVNASLTEPTSFTLFSNGKSYSVTVDSSTTYSDLVDAINTATGGDIVAKIVNTGEKDAPYRLTLTSAETGEDSAITFFDGTKNEDGQYVSNEGASTILSNLGWNLDKTESSDEPIDSANFSGFGIVDDEEDPLHIQQAQDAKFTMDGIKMTRSSNTITDLGVGLTLTLNSTGEVNFDVQQDTESITTAMQELVDAYNDLVINLEAATDYNSESGTKGTLQGVSEVNSIRSNIISALFQSQSVEGTVEDDDGNKVAATVMLSLQDFGLTLSESGTLSFDSSTFNTKFNEDPEMAESFFSGITQYEDITHEGNLIETGSLKDKLTEGIEFNSGDFKIVYNYETYDFSKTASGEPFVLTGESEEEMLQNLVNHINSFRIEGLEVSLEEYSQNNETGYKLKFEAAGDSDFSIEGDSDFLKQFGLSATKLYSTPTEGLGVFSQLKETLEGIIGDEGSLTQYDESLTKEIESLTESKESTQALIDARYETMQNQFLQYEVILNDLNTQLNTITQMIEAANSNNN